MLAEDENFIRASRKVVEMTDCSTLIVKRGEFGVIAFHGEEIISLPAFPTEMVVDPTGCGDSFLEPWLHIWLMEMAKSAGVSYERL